jgi:hypothetical protein
MLANTIHRLTYKIRVQGVDCVTRFYVLNQTSYPDDEFGAKAATISAYVGNQLRTLLSQAVSVTEIVVDTPEYPPRPPVIFGAAATGARLGLSLPAHLYGQLHLFGVAGSSSPAKRNSARIPGLALVDVRAGHMIVNLQQTFAFVAFRLLAVPIADGQGLFVGAIVHSKKISGQRVWSKEPAKRTSLPTAIYTLKSRQR